MKGTLACIFTLFVPVMMQGRPYIHNGLTSVRLLEPDGTDCDRDAAEGPLTNLPWAIRIVLRTWVNEVTICIGAMIAPTYVLFAKNCYLRHLDKGPLYGAIAYGRDFAYSNVSFTMEGVTSYDIMRQEFYNVTGSPLMIGRLARALDAPGIEPICLPPAYQVLRTNITCTLSVWYGDDGIHEGGLSSNESMLILQVIIRSNHICDGFAGLHHIAPHYSRFCVTLAPHQAVTFRYTEPWGSVLSCVQAGKHYLYGIEHAPLIYPLNFFSPAFFYKVSTYVDTIRTVMGQLDQATNNLNIPSNPMYRPLPRRNRRRNNNYHRSNNNY